MSWRRHTPEVNIPLLFSGWPDEASSGSHNTGRRKLLLLEAKINQENSFLVLENRGHDLPCGLDNFEFFRTWRRGVFPLHGLPFILWGIV